MAVRACSTVQCHPEMQAFCDPLRPHSLLDLRGLLKRCVEFIAERLPVGPLGFGERLECIGKADDVEVEVVKPAFKRPS
jgi:hypothetical protein